ncbi:hypothetical protein KDAU_56010 [Dictyobacter aurantiacus]|uniref:Uncharacterized protein n=1 Tax=Dictyobacter aurantiacus TaxID=1936993 RepID=A0A401ZN37_9CHLR|nr:hypothetical protein KDAU_56010 [Dictyobacter aurantiacus]
MRVRNIRVWGTAWAEMGATRSGIVGGRGLPSLALAAQTTAEGRPYRGIAVLGDVSYAGSYHVGERFVLWGRVFWCAALPFCERLNVGFPSGWRACISGKDGLK